MDDRFKLATFVIAMFIAILTTDYLDKSLKFLTAKSDWWNLAIGLPFLLVTIATGLLVLRIKSLIKFAFFGAICLFIFLATQIYYFPAENKSEWDVLAKNWAEIGEYFGLIFFAMFVGNLILMSIGRIFRYIYNLFFGSSKVKIIKE